MGNVVIRPIYDEEKRKSNFVHSKIIQKITSEMRCGNKLIYPSVRSKMFVKFNEFNVGKLLLIRIFGWESTFK